MFAPNPALERQQQQSRGYVLGLILLIMFLSSQDLSPPSRRRMEAAQEMREGINKHREDIKEKIILDLSASNEQLEIENRKLKVAAIALFGRLKELGHPTSAAQFNLTGMGIYGGGGDVDGYIGEGLAKRDELNQGVEGAGASRHDAGPSSNAATDGDAKRRQYSRHRALLRGREGANAEAGETDEGWRPRP